MRDLDQVLLGVLDALADRLGHLARLTQAGTNVPGTVTDDDDRAEAEAPAALDDLRHTIDLDDALFERQLVRVDPRHGLGLLLTGLEVETGFARGIGQRANAAVVAETGAVEDDLVDAGCLGPLGDQSDRRCLACSDFVPLDSRRPFSSDEALASVRPALSSMTCA